MVLVEVGLPSCWIAYFFLDGNDESVRSELDLLEKKWEVANLRLVAYNQRITWHYNSKVKSQTFKEGDLMLSKVMQNTQEPNTGVLGPN